MNPAGQNRSLVIWEMGGGLFVILSGTLFHFFYEWSGTSDFVGLFAPVNESVWEHLKLGFWPLLAFSAVEFWFVRKKAANFLLAKLAGVVALELLIVSTFYTYTALTGNPILAVDIASFIFGVALCQVVSFLVFSRSRPSRAADAAGGAGLMVIAVAFMVFTHLPPRWGIFRDNRSGVYGPVKTGTGER